MLFAHQVPVLTDSDKRVINHAYRMDEHECITTLMHYAELDDDKENIIKEKAALFIDAIRQFRMQANGIDSFMQQYALSSEEGIALMCLAEALLRVPDKATIDALIKDKLSSGNWQAHLGQSTHFFVNATTWALMLTGKVLDENKQHSRLSTGLKRFFNRTGEPVIRKVVAQAMRIMSRQFVMGRTIKEALKRAKKLEEKGYRYSYDMLGEAAYTKEDALAYLDAYETAILAIGEATKGDDIYNSAGISIKLSALHPRYEVAQYKRVSEELTKRVLYLCTLAKKHNIALTIDAEESERLALSLDIFEAVFKHPDLAGWNGLGLALQSYQKRAFYILDYLAKLARRYKKRIMVRLIKGAYWDSEIKRCQMQGLNEYPVFTRKCFTDVSFQACAKKIFQMTDVIYPQFATHNAYSAALILSLAGEYRDFEFQCLHGMGQELYDQITPKNKLAVPCRIYAPVGSHEDLLPYLVRRLLENGANSSFVNRIVDEKASIDSLVESPVNKADRLLDKINQNIPLPKNIYPLERINTKGLDLANFEVINELTVKLNQYHEKYYQARPIVEGVTIDVPLSSRYSPNDKSELIGKVENATPNLVTKAMGYGQQAWQKWRDEPVDVRAACLLKMAELLEENSDELLWLLMQEAGKVVSDAVAEIREAGDFCRYYALEAKHKLKTAVTLTGYTGELNQLSYHGRGVMVCISPWNFPLAIFLGQIAACLVTGNTVVAKPAEQTPLIAAKACELFLRAGIPRGVLQLILGDGETVGAALVKDERTAGILFTGSTTAAKHIQRALAKKEGPIVPLIAETGGQNAMIVDSSALLEQVVVDVIRSSFGSSGQRCSALRVLYIQKDVYPRFKALLTGAMAELKVGNPLDLKTDIGPVIDEEALAMLIAHKKEMELKTKKIAEVSLGNDSQKGHFFAPVAFEIASIHLLKKEVFGPILHVIPYEKKALLNVIDDISSTGFGLTMGIHSRINDVVENIATKAQVGNCYVNRDMIGAVVGLQPFGGEGLSGTGPKAGGPNYLFRLCHERVLCIDTTAAGGNASLMSQSEE